MHAEGHPPPPLNLWEMARAPWVLDLGQFRLPLRVRLADDLTTDSAIVLASLDIGSEFTLAFSAALNLRLAVSML